MNKEEKLKTIHYNNGIFNNLFELVLYLEETNVVYFVRDSAIEICYSDKIITVN